MILAFLSPFNRGVFVNLIWRNYAAYSAIGAVLI
jgi:hypothetical protein